MNRTAIHTTIINRDDVETNFDEECLAANLLSGAEFKLYRYFMNYPAGQTLYTRAKFCAAMGSHPKTADISFHALIEKGYLKEKSENLYNFFTTPV